MLGGCANKNEQQQAASKIRDKELSELRQTNKQLTGQLDQLTGQLNQSAEKQKQLQQLVDDLQRQVLEKHKEVNRLASMNENLATEAYSKSTIRSRGNKAEIVSFIAEVDTVIASARESKPKGMQKDALLRAEKYLAESKNELEKDNVEGASDLATKALELVRKIQRGEVPDSMQESDAVVNFPVPLRMKLLETSKVRKDPSLDAKVKFVLGEGSTVSAVGYQGEWVKVSIKERGSGWIHYSLLIGVPE